MKHLILYSHMGNKLLDLEIFVVGEDFKFRAPTPTAFWLGKIIIVDKEPEPERQLAMEVIMTPTMEVSVIEEVKNESETTGDSSVGDSGTSPAIELESAERIHQETAGGEPPKRSRKPRKPKATKGIVGGRIVGSDAEISNG